MDQKVSLSLVMDYIYTWAVSSNSRSRLQQYANYLAKNDLLFLITSFIARSILD